MNIETIFDSALRSLSGGSTEGKKYLLAVSGGIDSMSMASLFLHSRLRPEFAIAHVNFSLRGEDSDGDMQSVLDWGKAHDVKVYTATFDTHAYADEHSLSTQMAARELRYDFFRKIMQEDGFDFLSVAHNLDDSIETVFLNMSRGTGLRGLSGIQARNGNIIRPLLEVTRAEIVEYVAAQSIAYRDDRTNFESHYARNRIRNIIFPEFKKINPSFLATVRRNAEYVSQASDVLDDMYADVRSAVCSEDGDVLLVEVASLRSRGHLEYWLFRILTEFGFRSGQIPEIVKCLEDDSDPTGKTFVSGTHELLFDRGLLKVYPLGEDEEVSFVIDAPGEYYFRGTRFSVEFFPRIEDFDPKAAVGVSQEQSLSNKSDGVQEESGSSRRVTTTLFLSGDSVKMPLICRGWQAADRFRPFGMKAGSKKLSDLFTDLKLDRRAKAAQPVLTSADGDIVCLPGLRIADSCRITPQTSIVIEITLSEF